MFDYWYYESTRGRRSRTYHRFTCALVTIPAACPRLRLGHETSSPGSAATSVCDDVELEYDEFNRRFRVKCDDQKFAFSLLDGRMMQWLLVDDGFDSLEVDGPWVLVAGTKLDPCSLARVSGRGSSSSLRQIPPVVYSTYPPR